MFRRINAQNWLRLALLFVCFDTAFCAPISFSTAVKAAAAQGPAGGGIAGRSNSTICPEQVNNLRPIPDLDSPEDLPLQMDNSAFTKIRHGQTLPREFRPEPDSAGATEPDVIHQNCSPALRVASVYSQLSWGRLQLEVLQREHETAERLVRVEKMRIVGGVDGELSLLHAELLESRSRARELRLDGEMQELQSALANMIRIPDGDLEVDLDSIPGASIEAIEEAENHLGDRDNNELQHIQDSIATLRATRDALQLVYLLAERNAVRTSGLGKATLGDELASHIRADDKLVDLLQVTMELQHAQFGLFEAAGRLEDWADSASSDSNEEQTAERASLDQHDRLAAKSSMRLRDGENEHGVAAPLLLPAEGSLRVLGSRQMAAISTGKNSGKDVTTTVKWSSLNDSVAIVSSFGLVTGLRPGKCTISAKLGSAVKKKLITVTPYEPPSGK